MPYPFVLPTTSAFSFTSHFTCPTHPSLLRNASTYRGVVRDTLKRHKRLPPDAQASNLALVVSSLQNYLPYLFAVVNGLSGGARAAGVQVIRRTDTEESAKSTKSTKTTSSSSSPSSRLLPIEWRPTLSDARSLPGKEPPRVRVPSLDHELAFALATLGHAYTLQARAALQPLYVVTSVVPVGGQQRLGAITAATKHLLEAASVFAFLGAWTGDSSHPSFADARALPPDIAPPVLRALSALALAEATLLAVLKDDPYPAVVAQDRNEYDREWMYKAPDIPKVRAHLFARLCLAAADHAGQASAGAGNTHPPLQSAFLRYLQDLQHTSHAKACRFFAIDAELGDQTGTALAWLHAALHELGVDVSTSAGADGRAGGSSGSGKGKHLLSRFKKERSEKKEDRRVERGQGWGGDAGRLEETRVLEMLDAKWTKQNDTMNTQLIPPSGPLLAQMPSGREIHTVKAFEPPSLDGSALEAMRAPPDPLDELDEDFGDGASSSDEEDGASASRGTPVGAYPGTGRSAYF